MVTVYCVFQSMGEIEGDTCTCVQSRVEFVRPKQILDGTVDKTWLNCVISNVYWIENIVGFSRKPVWDCGL